MTCGFGPEYDKLKEQLGEAKAVAVFHLAGETVPSLEKALELLQTPEVKFALKSVEIANSIPAKREWIKLQNNKISIDQFLLNTQFPKEQKDLVRQVYAEDNPKTLDDLILGINSRMSYTVEINTAKSQQDLYGEKQFDNIEDAKKDFESRQGIPTQHYSNMTVPGGTAYQENEIATPGIVPSIKGHAQFSTENGVGWHRSDDQINHQSIDSVIDTLKQSGRLKVIC